MTPSGIEPATFPACGAVRQPTACPLKEGYGKKIPLQHKNYNLNNNIKKIHLILIFIWRLFVNWIIYELLQHWSKYNKRILKVSLILL